MAVDKFIWDRFRDCQETVPAACDRS